MHILTFGFFISFSLPIPFLYFPLNTLYFHSLSIGFPFSSPLFFLFLYFSPLHVCMSLCICLNFLQSTVYLVLYCFSILLFILSMSRLFILLTYVKHKNMCLYEVVNIIFKLSGQLVQKKKRNLQMMITDVQKVSQISYKKRKRLQKIVYQKQSFLHPHSIKKMENWRSSQGEKRKKLKLREREVLRLVLVNDLTDYT